LETYGHWFDEFFLRKDHVLLAMDADDEEMHESAHTIVTLKGEYFKCTQPDCIPIVKELTQGTEAVTKYVRHHIELAHKGCFGRDPELPGSTKMLDNVDVKAYIDNRIRRLLCDHDLVDVWFANGANMMNNVIANVNNINNINEPSPSMRKRAKSIAEPTGKNHENASIYDRLGHFFEQLLNMKVVYGSKPPSGFQRKRIVLYLLIWAHRHSPTENKNEVAEGLVRNICHNPKLYYMQ
jgi:hypothetical protein